MRVVVLLDLIAVFGLGAFILLGLAVPMGAILREFLPHLSGLWDPELLATVKLTVFQAGVSSILATLIGVAVAVWLPRNSRLIRALLGIPFGVPAVAAAAAWVICLPRVLSFSISAVVIAHVFFNAPWIALWMLRALDEVSHSQTEAAATMGASRIQVFRYLTLPVVRPAILSGFAQVFSFCAMSFILVMILGGGPPVETLETTLFSRIRAGGLDLSGAAACAIWQVLITMTPWILVRKSGFVQISDVKQEGKSTSLLKRSFGFLSAGLFLVPYFALFVHLKFSNFADTGVVTKLGPALWTSLELAVLTALLSVILGLLGIWAETRNRFFAQIGSLAMVIPSGVSVMVLGVGFFIAYGKYLDPFSSSIWPVVFLQAIFFVPVAFRVFQPISKHRRKGVWDAAMTLGATPVSAFGWVEWPRWRGPVFGVLTLIAGAALGEVGAVSLFYNENRIPVALLISRWMGQYRFEDAQVLSLGLMLVSATLISVGFLSQPSGGST